MNKFTVLSLGVALIATPGVVLGQHGHGGGGLHLGSSMSSNAGASVGKGITAGGGLSGLASGGGLATASAASSMSKGLAVGGGLGNAASMGGGLAKGGGLSMSNASMGVTMSTNHASPAAFAATSKTATQVLPVSPNSFLRTTRTTSATLLTTRAQALLPAGTSVQTAAMGFRDQREFLTTLHVANDLNIPFNQLKSLTTGAQHESLAKAIATLDPNLSRSQIRTDIHIAERQAGRDLLVSRLSTRMAGNQFLANRVQSLLPAGMTLQQAEAGFRNKGQFLAALHVSHNLGISFTDLKAKMTGPNPESLGRAIQDLRPHLSSSTVKTDVETAEREAENDTEAMLEREDAMELGTMARR